VWLLQSLRSVPEDRGGAEAAPIPVDGLRVAGRPAAAGTAAGPLVACWPHETGAKDCRGAIVLVDRPVPALAPLLFGARGVISRAGAAGSHLAEVARSLGVPMVVGCHPETVTGPGPAPGAWLATINGGTGEVVLTPA
jgi:phosphohistidine swiveling domain-containing protein